LAARAARFRIGVAIVAVVVLPAKVSIVRPSGNNRPSKDVQ
jgi:hypothetical protein